jgi:regulator of nonsense transcripts 2
MPDDFFRVRLVCVLLDTCGMCFDHGSLRKKLDNFLVFFHVSAPLYIPLLMCPPPALYIPFLSCVKC